MMDSTPTIMLCQQQLNASQTNNSADFNMSTPCLAGESTLSTGNGSVSTFSGLAIQDVRIWTLFVVIGIIGIVGNALVALVLLRFTNMRRRLTNIYIINQSLVDCTASIFLLVTTVYQDQNLPAGFAGELKCRLWLVKIPFWSMMMASAFNLVAITVERYFKIVHPIAHRVSFTRRTALISVALVWLLGWAYMLANNLAVSGVVNGVCQLGTLYPNYTAKQSANVVHFLLQYLAPISVFAFCYTKMALVLHRGSFKTAPVGPVADGQAHTGNGKAVNAASKRAVVNVVKTMVVVSFALFVCFSPNQWLFFLYSFGVFDNRIFSNPIYNISVIAMYLNCCINPAIYVASYQQFQVAVRQLLCPKMTKTGESGTAMAMSAASVMPSAH